MNGKIIVDLICLGSLKEKSMREMVAEYDKRLSKYSKLKIVELKDESNNLNEAEVLKKEADKILKVLDKNSHIIVLDIDKKQYSSEEFATKLNDISTYSSSKITFIIGGSYGLSQEIKSIANESMSFSKMTFPHQLFRVMFLEQLYRAFTINAGTKYHK